MKVRIVSRPWSLEMAERLEAEINAFLADLPDEAVKHIDTQIVAARSDDGTVKSESIISIWYEGSATASTLPPELKDLETGAELKKPGVTSSLDKDE
jgi:hypothetical protein